MVHLACRTGARIRVSETEIIESGEAQGNAITLLTSTNVWIDHCYFDGVVDTYERKHIVVKWGSELVTISNSRFENQWKVRFHSNTSPKVKLPDF